MADFKIGDRVLYKAGTAQEMRGTIVSRYTGTLGDPEGSWWVQWVGHTQRLWVDSYKITLDTSVSPGLKEAQSLNHSELKNSEVSLRSWILKDSPSTEEIHGACKFLEFSEA